MTYKLIALDIDGTLRTPHYELSERTKTAINTARKAGALVTVVTGRMFLSALSISDDLGLTTPIVAIQGALVANPVTKTALLHQPLTTKMAIDVVESIRGWDGELLIYSKDHVYTNKLTPWIKAYGERNRSTVEILGDLNKIAKLEAVRVAIAGKNADLFVLDMKRQGKFSSGPYITKTLQNFCEILHPKAGKHRGLAWLTRYLNLKRENIIAVGNGYEDAEMLEWAGLGVAVSDGAPEALQAADMVVDPITLEGPSKFIETLVESGHIG